MKLRAIFAIGCMIGMANAVARADDGRFAIAAKAGTLGLGGDVSVNLLQDLNLRFGYGTFPFNYDSTIDGIDYKFKVDLQMLPLMIDWYPFHNSFHLSGGVIFNNTDVDLRAKSSSSVTLNGQTYTADQAGTLSGDVSFNKVAPYAGIGWGNPFNSGSRLGLMCDLGVAFTGRPDVALHASGPYASDPTFQSNLAQEQRDVQSKADKFKLYPVLSLSLYFRF